MSRAHHAPAFPNDSQASDSRHCVQPRYSICVGWTVRGSLGRIHATILWKWCPCDRMTHGSFLTVPLTWSSQHPCEWQVWLFQFSSWETEAQGSDRTLRGWLGTRIVAKLVRPPHLHPSASQQSPAFHARLQPSLLLCQALFFTWMCFLSSPGLRSLFVSAGVCTRSFQSWQEKAGILKSSNDHSWLLCTAQ